MALKPKVTKEEFAKLPADVQKEYVERDGDHWLDVTPQDGFELADVKKLKSTVETTRKERDEFKAKLTPFKDLDPEKAREALSKMDEIDKWDPDEKLSAHKEKFERQLSEKYTNEQKQLITKHTEALAQRDAELKTLTSQLEQEMITSAATAAISAEKGSVELLLPVIRAKTRLRKGDDGKLITEVLSADGSVRLGPGAGNTSPMTVNELVAEMKKDPVLQRAFDGTGTSGSGAQGGGNRTAGTGQFVLTGDQAKDPAAYRRVKAEAEKAGQSVQLQG